MIKQLTTEQMIDALTKDFLDRDGDTFVRIRRTDRLGWEDTMPKDTPYSEKILKPRNVEELYSNAHSLAKDMITAMNPPFKVNVRLSMNNSMTNGRDLFVATKVFDDKDLTLGKKLDTFTGLAVHEGCHLLYTDFRMLATCKNKIIKNLENIIEDERIERRCGEEKPGLANFLCATKYYYFDKYTKDLEAEGALNGLTPATRLINCILGLIRYPKALKMDDLREFAEVLLKVRSLLIPYPDSTEKSIRTAEAIYEVIKQYYMDEENGKNERQRQNRSKADAEASSKKNGGGQSSDNDEDASDGESSEGENQESSKSGKSDKESDSQSGKSSDKDSEDDGEESEASDSDEENCESDSENETEGSSSSDESEEDTYEDTDEDTEGEAEDDSCPGNEDDTDSESSDEQEGSEQEDSDCSEDGSADDEDAIEDNDNEESESDSEEEDTDNSSENEDIEDDRTPEEKIADALRKLAEDEDQIADLLDDIAQSAEEGQTPSPGDMCKDLYRDDTLAAICEGSAQRGITSGTILTYAQDNKDRYTESLNRVKKYIPAIAKILTSNSTEYRFTLRGMRSGLLDTDKLAEARQGVQNIYIRKGEVRCDRCNVAILIDESGSMEGYKETAARDTAVLLNEAIGRQNNVDLFIYGFTSSMDRNSIRIFNDRKSRNRYALGSTNNYLGTPTGQAILEARDQVRKANKEHCLLFVITDGKPGDRNLNKAAVQAAQKDNMSVVGISIDPKLDERYMKDIYDNYVILSDMSTLAPRLGKVVKQAVLKTTKQHIVL